MRSSPGVTSRRAGRGSASTAWAAGPSSPTYASQAVTIRRHRHEVRSCRACCVTRATPLRPSHESRRRLVAITGSISSPASARRATFALEPRDGIACAACRHQRPVERRARYAVAEARSCESRRRRVGGERQRRSRRAARRAERSRSGARRRCCRIPACRRERERLLSSPFIVSGDYGTRCSTVVALSRDGAVQLVERSFNASGEVTGDVEFRFIVKTTCGAA